MKFNKSFSGLTLLAILGAFTPTINVQALETLTSNSIPTIIAEMNADRAAYGLAPLRPNSALSSAAQNRSEFLSTQGKIFHLSAPAGTPWPEIWNTGYHYTEAGENLALGIETTSTLEDRWMNSPTHRANILNDKYEDVGVGVTSGAYYGTPASYVVVYFGKKAPAGAVPVSSVQGKTAQSGGTTQSTVSAGVAKAIPLPAAASQDTEKVRILTQLISYLQTYLKMFESSGLL